MSQSSTEPLCGAAGPSDDYQLLTGPEVAKHWGVSKSGWYTLVREGKAPSPDEVGPWGWKTSTIAEWEKTIPTVEEAIEKLKIEAEQKGKLGEWKLFESP